MRRGAALAALAVLATADSAHAHAVIEGVTGFSGGFLHPLLVPAHLILLLALGLLAGQQDSSRRRLLIAAVLSAFAIAIGLVASAFAFPETQNAVLAILLLAGVLVATGRTWPVYLTAPVFAAGGIALVLDSVPALISIADTLLALAGTALSSALLLVSFAILAARCDESWQRIGIRILGSWAAASAILVLALRLAG
jgi:urease accessory protein